ncbi:MAG: hypothetical protein HC859_05655 [Bacteroidia bacterium]|nr:hypothetical protein [Bacteroidia bacterium]
MLKRGLDEEESARIIGANLPTVKDRLVNLVQLTVAGRSSSLALASVQQRSHELAPVSFEGVIDLRQNGKYLRYLAAPVLLVLLLLVFDRDVITQSTSRIIHFNQQYAPQAPFAFQINPQGLTAFYNEDYVLELQLEGKAIPDNAYLINGNSRNKMSITGRGAFSFVFDKIQQNQTVQIEAAGFYSNPFTIRVANRPEMTGFSVELEYPKYLRQKKERIVNAGNLEVPEGTVVKWNLLTAHADQASITFGETPKNEFQSPDNQVFTYSRRFTEASAYEIELQNADSKNKERIAYNIAVVKDQYPQIAVNNLKDSVLYKRIILGGLVSDDHGVSQLTLHYTVQDENQRTITSKSKDLSVGRNQIQQSFFYNWALDSLELRAGNQLIYYLQVWDNDGVNGRKSTKTSTYSFFVPSKDNLLTEISKSQSQTQQSLDQSVGKANKLQDKIEEASQKLKGKQNLDWQDKKMLEDILQQKLNLDKAVQQLNEENKLLEEKKGAFTEQDERIKEKAEQIQKLMDELLDEETKKLFEELQKLLQENQDISEIQKLLNKMSQNTNNLEKELERTLELFKQLQYDFKLDQTIDQVKEQAEKQKALLEKTESLEKEQGKKYKDKKTPATKKRREQRGCKRPERQ